MSDVVRLHEQFSILATSSEADERTRVLKHGESFAVFDLHGDLHESAGGKLGLFHEGTRHLSRLELSLGSIRPLLLGSAIEQANDVLSVDLTNPDVRVDDVHELRRGALHISRTTFLWDGACYCRLRVANYALSGVDVSLRLAVAADFADIFEVRGTARSRRGLATARVDGRSIVLTYDGLDRVVRRTRITSDPHADAVTPSGLRWQLTLNPRASQSLVVTIVCERGGGSPPRRVTYDEGVRLLAATHDRWRDDRVDVRGSNRAFDDWMARSFADVLMMLTSTPHGAFPYAGVPWFSTPFGRDALVTALELLWLDPSVAASVLRFLAATQATEVDARRDAEPGKILHEMRGGEMAALGEVPFGRYYGSVDATPLFVFVAGEYFERTGDRELVVALWPHLLAALGWMERFGDADGDGFIEYARATPRGLANQGWKDSADSVFHADGALAEGPIALCEVQAYAYGAWRHAAQLALLVGDHTTAARATGAADRLRTRFEEAFWCDDLGTYALALDGAKRPCRIRTSNAGHCLLTGLASPDRARRLADTLFSDASYSGWGIRTVAETERRYNPMSYHNGSVWPHDNALIALGLARYGHQRQAARLLAALAAAAGQFDLDRLPELFCGFPRTQGEAPIEYPVACAPQAWAAASGFLLLQAALGLKLDAARHQVSFNNPVLPEPISDVRLHNLRLGTARLTVRCEQRPHDVGVTILERSGEVKVVRVS